MEVTPSGSRGPAVCVCGGEAALCVWRRGRSAPAPGAAHRQRPARQGRAAGAGCARCGGEGDDRGEAEEAKRGRRGPRKEQGARAAGQEEIRRREGLPARRVDRHGVVPGVGVVGSSRRAGSRRCRCSPPRAGTAMSSRRAPALADQRASDRRLGPRPRGIVRPRRPGSGRDGVLAPDRVPAAPEVVRRRRAAGVGLRQHVVPAADVDSDRDLVLQVRRPAVGPRLSPEAEGDAVEVPVRLQVLADEDIATSWRNRLSCRLFGII